MQIENRRKKEMKACRNSPVCSWLLLLSLLCLWMSVHSSEDPSLPLRAVNLGGWLVTEGWITPSLFDGITNKDLLDGTKVQFKSIAWGKYLCAENQGEHASKIVANRMYKSSWETFKLWRHKHDQFQFRAFDGRFVRLGARRSRLVAKAQTQSESETFQIIPNQARPELVHIKAMSNGMYVQAKSEDMVTADFDGEPGWEDSSKAVFVMNVTRTLQGEFQVTNGLGRERATQVMKKHWREFITEADFEFIANHGFNAVRIPVGWWTAETSTPQHPFVKGSLHYLDKAFTWAGNHGLKVILDLHAPPDSQNGQEHSGTRDGTIEFGSQESIDRAVKTIEKFMERYANSPSLFAVELINEPHAPKVSLDAITKYYEAGYKLVRKYAPTAYVIMSDRLGKNKQGKDPPPTELLDLAKRLPGTIIDVHYYNFFEESLKNNAEKNIDFVLHDRADELEKITPRDRVPLSFVGEWAAVWNVSHTEEEDYRRFVDAQLKVYGGASFGWAYWTYRADGKDSWSLRWMIDHGYITREKLESGRV